MGPWSWQWLRRDVKPLKGHHPVSIEEDGAINLAKALEPVRIRQTWRTNAFTTTHIYCQPKKINSHSMMIPRRLGNDEKAVS